MKKLVQIGEGRAVISMMDVNTPSHMVPDDAIEVDVPDGFSPLGKYVEQDGTLVLVEPAPTKRKDILASVSIEEIQAIAKTELNSAISAVRAKHITKATGQDMLYMAKEAEARQFLNDPLMVFDYPLLESEVRGVITEYQVAQIVLNLSHIWRQIAAVIECYKFEILDMIEKQDISNLWDIIETDHVEEMLLRLSQS